MKKIMGTIAPALAEHFTSEQCLRWLAFAQERIKEGKTVPKGIQDHPDHCFPQGFP